MLLSLSALVSLLAPLLGAGAAAPPSTAEALARRVEERQRNVQDLQGRFTQTYRSGVLGREVVERGTVSIKRPGRMRWEYRDPEAKTFVSDGKSFYFYVPADKQVIVRDQADSRGVTAMLLSGRLDILGQFEVGLEKPPSGNERLRMLPRKPDGEVDRIYLELDASDRIRSIEILDPQGNRSRFDFQDLRENVGLPDRLFHFDIPRGVEVVTG
jgi:outer membrane lipoprotein carrier protein